MFKWRMCMCDRHVLSALHSARTTSRVAPPREAPQLKESDIQPKEKAPLECKHIMHLRFFLGSRTKQEKCKQSKMLIQDSEHVFTASTAHYHLKDMEGKENIA
eukprot:scaffold301975_cov17-Tisochrysis_lutea.AAC.2